MVAHVAADPASPDVLDLACSPTEPTFAAATAAQPGARGAQNLPCVFRHGTMCRKAVRSTKACTVTHGARSLGNCALSLHIAVSGCVVQP